MEGNDNQFFYENEVAVTKNIIRILRWLILAFPAIMIFSVADDSGWSCCNNGTYNCL